MTGATVTAGVASAARRLLVRSRPRFWLYLAGPVVVGVTYGARSTSALTAPAAVALFAYFLLPANVYVYGVNDVFDADADADNPRKSGREARYRGDTLTVVATVVGGALGFVVLAVMPAPARPWLLGFLVLAAAYSAPPLRFKSRPFLDSLSNGLYVLPGVAAYAAVAGRPPPALAVAAGWLWAMGMHTFSAVPDIEYDRASGVATTATVLGQRRALAYCGACWLAAAAGFWMLAPRAGGLLLTYPVFLAGIAAADVAVEDAYWWFPAVNTAVGALLTVGGLWRLTHG